METDRTKKLGVFIWFGYRIPVSERVRLIREAGFETALHWWDDSFLELEGCTKEEQADLIRHEGLYIENAHLRTEGVNCLWLDNLDGQTLLEQYLNEIDGLAACEIPVAVLHLTSGAMPPPTSDTGLRRVRTLVERAERRGVRLAVENVRSNLALNRVLDSIDSPALGFCYDSGHDLIWSREPYELLSRYGGRLYAVHLHDNLGVDDDHLAPGAGTVDWETVRAGIARSAYTGSYTLESDSAEIPLGRTPQEHLRMHCEGAKKIFLSEQ